MNKLKFYILFSVLVFGINQIQAQLRVVKVTSPINFFLPVKQTIQVTFLVSNQTSTLILNNKGETSVSGVGPLTIYINTNNDSIEVFNQTYGANQFNIDIELKKADLELDPITITASFKNKRISANPYNIKVIGRQKILAMAAQNLGDVLQNETNIELGQDATLGTSAVLQGVGGNGIKILLNGIPYIGRLNGNIDISQIPMSNVDRIEIIDGPMSIIYGSDALGGVINVITKTPINQKIAPTANVYIDGINNYNLDLGLTHSIAKKVPIMLNVSRHFFGGKDFNLNNRVQDWKPRLKYFADLSTIIQRKKISFRYISNYYYDLITDRSEAEYGLNTVQGFNSYFYTHRFDNQFHLTYKLNNNSHFDFQNSLNYYSRVKKTTKIDLSNREERPYRPQDQDTTNFKLINSRGVYIFNSNSKRIGLNVGYDFVHETGFGKRVPVTNPGITDLGGFATLEYSPNSQLSLQSGIRIVNNSRYGSSIIKNYGDANGRAPLIPSLQFKYAVSKHLIFRGSYSKGYRSPSIKELFFNFVDINHNLHGNPNLLPETSNNFNLNMDYRHRISKAISTTFNFSIFYNSVKNKINLALEDALTNYYTYINIGNFQTQGISTKFEFNKDNWGLTVSNTLLTVIDEIYVEDTAKQQLTVNSQLAVNLTYKLKKYNSQFNLISRYTSPTLGYNQNGTRYKINQYYLSDLNYAGYFYKNKIRYQFGVKNIFGITNIETNRQLSNGAHESNGASVAISPGRTLFISLNYGI